MDLAGSERISNASLDDVQQRVRVMEVGTLSSSQVAAQQCQQCMWLCLPGLTGPGSLSALAPGQSSLVMRWQAGVQPRSGSLAGFAPTWCCVQGGTINKSLLTLGTVIRGLSEQSTAGAKVRAWVGCQACHARGGVEDQLL